MSSDASDSASVCSEDFDLPKDGVSRRYTLLWDLIHYRNRGDISFITATTGSFPEECTSEKFDFKLIENKRRDGSSNSLTLEVDVMCQNKYLIMNFVIAVNAPRQIDRIETGNVTIDRYHRYIFLPNFLYKSFLRSVSGIILTAEITVIDPNEPTALARHWQTELFSGNLEVEDIKFLIIADQRSFTVDTFILKYRSPFFRQFLSMNPDASFLYIPLDKTVVKEFLRYLYTGRYPKDIYLNPKEYLRLGLLFQLDDLVIFAQTLLIKYTCGRNALAMLRFGHMYGMLELKSAALRCIAAQYQTYTDSSEATSQATSQATSKAASKAATV